MLISITGVLTEFEDAQFRASTTRVVVDLLLPSGPGTHGQYRTEWLEAADAVRQVRRTMAGIGPFTQCMLHQPVLQGMKADYRQP